MGSRVSRVLGFLPANFQLATLFHTGLRVRRGTDRQTDRRTDGQRDDGHHCIVPIQGDGGIIIIVNNNNKRRLKYPLTNCHKGSCEQSVTISHTHQVSVNSWNQVLKSLEIRARAVFQNNFSETGRSSTIFERRVVIQLMIKSLIWVENHLCFFHRKSSYSRT